jgi:hypothetical protein
MPEGKNVEIAHGLAHRPANGSTAAEQKAERRHVEILEILEALLLAVVAVATAWSGYQSARWDGRSALGYGEAATLRARANQLATLGGQQKLLDVSTFNVWIDAMASGHPQVAALYVQRFSPEYRVAFDAWLKTNPLHNPKAPSGPAYMLQYHNHLLEHSAVVDAQATARFNQGTDARETGDKYVRTTVILATVLFLVAISQRFDIQHVRLSLLWLSLVLLGYAVYSIVSYAIA